MTARRDIARIGAAPERGEPLTADIADAALNLPVRKVPGSTQVSRQDVLTLIDQALAMQAAAHAAEMTTRDAAIAELKAVVHALTASGASPVKPNFVPIKRACGQVGVIYENARRWCERGLVVARKDGGRWFVDQISLTEYAARLHSR